MKVKCQFCEKEEKGKCRAKKNVSVELHKPRSCTKYVYDKKKDEAELRRKIDALKAGMSPQVHRLPQSYYDNIFSTVEAQRNPVVSTKQTEGEKKE